MSLSVEFPSNLVVEGLNVFSCDPKDCMLWKKDLVALPVSARFHLLHLKELWRPTRRHDRVVTTKEK